MNSNKEHVLAIPHYKEKDDDHTKLGRQRNVNEEDYYLLQKEFKEEINFNDQYWNNKEPFIKMMTGLGEM